MNELSSPGVHEGVTYYACPSCEAKTYRRINGDAFICETCGFKLTGRDIHRVALETGDADAWIQAQATEYRKRKV